jgi:hypothetical protein
MLASSRTEWRKSFLFDAMTMAAFRGALDCRLHLRTLSTGE